MSFLQDAQIMIPAITGVALTVFGRSVEAYRTFALMMVSNTETIVPLNPVQIKLDVKKSEDLPVQIPPAFSNEQTVNQNYAWELQIMEAE